MRDPVSLPPALFAHVLSYALYDDANALIPTKASFPLQEAFTMSMVSKPWRSMLLESMQSAQCGSFTFTFRNADRTELMELVRSVTLRRRYLRDLTIMMGSWGYRKERFSAFVGNNVVDEVLDVDWTLVFSHCHHLERLDLSKIPLVSTHTIRILESVAQCCPQLKALILPAQHDRQVPLTSIEGDAIMASLTMALQAWYKSQAYSTQSRGLRQFTVPSRVDPLKASSCDAFVKSIAQYCPNIEHLDGYKATLVEMDRVTCEDQWIIGPEVWRDFCKQCTQLREFQWIVVPLSDQFFEIFGQFPKPRLQNLVFQANMKWDWYHYLQETNPTHPYLTTNAQNAQNARQDATLQHPPGYGNQASQAYKTLAAVPNLKKVEVALYHPVDEEILSNLFLHHQEQPDEVDFLRQTWPAHEMMNQDMFGDAFCRALATHCPLLQEMSIWEAAERYNNQRLHTIRAFTDTSLIALSTLSYLEHVELKSVNVTGHGLFAFFNNMPTKWKQLERVAQITVGSIESDFELAFYNAVVKMLEECFTADVRCTDKKFVLRLVNGNFKSYVMTQDWREEYMTKLEELVANVKQKHANLRLRVTTRGRNRQDFSAICDFGVYTKFSTPSPWYGWEDTDGSDKIFWDQGPDRPENEADGDEDENYDDYDAYGDGDYDDSDDDYGVGYDDYYGIEQFYDDDQYYLGSDDDDDASIDDHNAWD